MSARVDPELVAPQSAALAPALLTNAVAAPSFDTDDRWGGHALPNDHPAWLKDVVSLSQRARAVVAQLKPLALQVVAFWEHRVRSIVVTLPGSNVAGKLTVDASGSYRFD